ncbi:MAG: hypothetical protein NT033_07830, partial [Candidatus Omnitrophica bacterium]|nr:hypothetical protein [Candidatus Omnitrophota bacterium]
MRRRTFSLTVFLLFCAYSFCQAKELQFRLVLKAEESRVTVFDKFLDGNGREILVSKKVLLSNSDIEQIGINKDEYGRSLAVIGFTDQGRKKYLDLTKKNINRQLAEIIEGTFLATYTINAAVDTGFAAVPVETLSDAEKLIKSLGFAPYLQRGIDNDKNAEVSYGYARYAMEKGKEKIARKISLQLYRYDPNSEFFKKLVKEYPVLSINTDGHDKLGQDCCSGHKGVCGNKCCDGISILAACEELYRDSMNFARSEPPKSNSALI